MSWYEESMVYQIYPLGLVGAPGENDGVQAHRIMCLVDDGWVDHVRKLGAGCVLFNPVFQSSSHGYDTIDFGQVDCRIGNAEDLRNVVDAFHKAGVRVILDAVFNHVGRDFWAFRDVREKRGDSAYAGWFYIDWNGESAYGDGFSYRCWEGVDSLVELNHHDFGLNDYCAETVRAWERDYDIDGLRLDVAYCLDPAFLGFLRRVADELSAKRGSKFLLLGETMFGDYNRWMGDSACDSVTNYECYKGLWSSMNDANMHEIAYALNRQSGSDPWTLYPTRHLLNFVDNHDVPRIATKLDDPRKLQPLYGLLFGMRGVPSVYYGSEWGALGEKLPGDRELRPAFDGPEWNSLTDWIASLALARNSSRALAWGGYHQIAVTPTALVFQREVDDDCVIVAINAGEEEASFHDDLLKGNFVDLLTQEGETFDGSMELPPFSCRYWNSSARRPSRSQ